MLRLKVYGLLYIVCLNYCTLARNKVSGVLLLSDTQSEEFK